MPLARVLDSSKSQHLQIVLSQRKMPKLQFIAGRIIRATLRQHEASTRCGRSIHPAIESLRMLPEKIRQELKSDVVRAPWTFPLGHQNDMFHFPEDLEVSRP